MQRAEWRIEPGKSAQRLSPHYRLDCDYGTQLITIFRESDASEPIYICETHLAAVERLGKKAATVGNEPQRTQSLDGKRNGDRASGAECRKEMLTVTVAATRYSGAPAAEASPTTNSNRDGIATPARTATPSRNGAPSPNSSAPATTSGLLSAKPRRAALQGKRVRAYTFGNSAKALVDEVIWNLDSGDYEQYRAALQNGKSELDAGQAAGGQLAVMVRKIDEYTRMLEGLLAGSKSIIKSAQVIDAPLEQAVLELIGKGETSDAKKDAIIEELGRLEESLKQGLDQEITPSQAFAIAHSIGKRANWGAHSDIPEELKAAYLTVYRNVRDAMALAAPGSLALFERLANLYAAKAELETTRDALDSNATHRES